MSEHEYLVPDGIEPLVGWKALRITPDGRLSSPQKTQAVWPPKQRLEAGCANGGGSYTWTPVFWPDETQYIVSHISGQPMDDHGLPPTPYTLLPPGYGWAWMPTPHQTVDPNCTCGIYIVKNLKEALPYLKQDCLLAEINLWGRIIPGSDGARGQYAYPKTLYAPDRLADVAILVADLYGVPISYRDHKTGATLTEQQALANLDRMKQQKREVLIPPVPDQPPTRDTDMRQGARNVAIFSTIVLLLTLLVAVTVSPYVLPLAIPFAAILPLAARDGWKP